MKTQYYTATSLDGFLATEDDSLEWLFGLGDVGETSYPAFVAEVGALAMGASTYAWMRAHEAQMVADTGAPWPYAQPTWVFTHRRFDVPEGATVHFVEGDVRPVHAAMVEAAAGRNLWVVGGGELAAQFHDAGLLDEVIVQVAAVTLGRGKPLFPRRIPSGAWSITAVRPMGSRMVELRMSIAR